MIDDRNLRELGVALLPAPKLPPVHDRHHQVEEDDAGGLSAVEVDERLLPVGGGDSAVPFILEELAKGIPDVLVIIDHKYDSG